MNIFILDDDMYKSAEYLVNKHVVKMITEHNQLLCSVFYYTDFIPDEIYKLSHKNHPHSIWARSSLSNWIWLRDYTLEICKEYTYRYGKIHKGEHVCKSLPNPNIKDIGLLKFPQCMPDEYKNDNVVKAYRNYYNEDKQHIFQWYRRNIPPWIIVKTLI